MKNQEIINEDCILLNVVAKNQKAVFQAIAEVAKTQGCVKKARHLIKAFQKREKESSTGFGDGFAIPHARTNNILKAKIFFCRLQLGVAWNALDNNPVNVVIALVVPGEKAAENHLELLSQVAQKIIKPEIQTLLKTSSDKALIIKELMN